MTREDLSQHQVQLVSPSFQVTTPRSLTFRDRMHYPAGSRGRAVLWSGALVVVAFSLLVSMMVVVNGMGQPQDQYEEKTEVQQDISMDAVSLDFVPIDVMSDETVQNNELNENDSAAPHGSVLSRSKREKVMLSKGKDMKKIIFGKEMNSLVKNVNNVNIFEEMVRINQLEPERAEEEIRRMVGKQMASAMDQEVDPCMNFYRYACGRWSNQNRFPDDVTEQTPFMKATLHLQTAIKDLIETEKEQDEKLHDSKAFQLISTFYKSCMNQEAVEEKGSEPIFSILEEVLGGWPVMDSKWNPDNFQWEEAVAAARKLEVQAIIGEKVGPALGPDGVYVIQFDQPTSIGFPSPSYFTKPAAQKARDAYLNMMSQTANLLGADIVNAREQMNKVFQFEMSLAKLMLPRGARRNLTAHYVRTTLRELEDAVPGINFSGYLTSLVLEPSMLTPNLPVVTFALPYLQAVSELIANTDQTTLANVIGWRIVQTMLPYMTQRFWSLNDRLSQAMGAEVTKAPERWRVCLQHTNSLLPSALGAVFAPKFLPEDTKEEAEEVADEIRKAFSRSVDRTDWISNSTRKMARNKLRKMALNIGYADEMLDEKYQEIVFKSINVQMDELLQNVAKIQKSRVKRKHARLNHPIQNEHWGASPTVMNAIFSHDHNRMTIPAAMLSPPFFHNLLPMSINYGALGSIAGHEMSHALEERGRLFDADGQLNDWWDPEDVESFNNRSLCVQEKYSKLQPVSAMEAARIAASVGEDMADIAGVGHAFRAYRHVSTKYTDEEKATEALDALPNLKPKQLFFVAYAQMWCSGQKPTGKDILGGWDASRGVHTPPGIRVLGALSNFEEFGKAFHCYDDSPMNPDERCPSWQ